MTQQCSQGSPREFHCFMHVGHQAFASTGRRSVDWPADGEYNGSGPITFLCLTPYSYRQAICLGELSAHTQPALLSNRITEGRTMLTERKQSLTSQDWLHGPFRVSVPIDVAGTVTKWMHEMSPSTLQTQCAVLEAHSIHTTC